MVAWQGATLKARLCYRRSVREAMLSYSRRDFGTTSLDTIHSHRVFFFLVLACLLYFYGAGRGFLFITLCLSIKNVSAHRRNKLRAVTTYSPIIHRAFEFENKPTAGWTKQQSSKENRTHARIGGEGKNFSGRNDARTSRSLRSFNTTTGTTGFRVHCPFYTRVTLSDRKTAEGIRRGRGAADIAVDIKIKSGWAGHVMRRLDKEITDGPLEQRNEDQ